MSKFVVGDRVAFVQGKIKFSEDSKGPACGIITDLLSTGSVMVKWDLSYKGHTTVDPVQLLPESEAKEQWSKLEQAFDRIAEEVKAKLKEAGALIVAASDFADENGFDMQEMWKATSVLEDAMENAGWNTSSWHC